jgi:hypothetical protein
MFVRVKRSTHGGRSYEYLQIVESFRDGASVRQRVIANLGRRDELLVSGTLDKLIESLVRFSDRLQLVGRVRSEGLRASTSRSWGAPLVFRRLWERQRLPELFDRYTTDRRFGFDVDCACFALSLQRLMAPGSDLQGSAWVETVHHPGFDRLELHHFYRTVGLLADVREDLERDLFQMDRDLFSDELDLVFIDTTSTFFWRTEETELRRRGHSRDRRPDQPQVVLCVAVDRRGWPIAWDVLPGNTSDKRAFVQAIERFRERFQIRRAVVVADRGMISKKTIELLEGDAAAPFDFILGCRMRHDNEVKEEVLSRAGRYERVEENLEVKEVRVGERRYIVCRNPIEAKKDQASREAIVRKLQGLLERQGPKAVIGNRGFARFVRMRRGSVELDEAAIERDARLDGKFVLRTSTDLPAAEVAEAYKGLWRVERTFRESKSTLEVRPVYHQTDRNVTGHIVGCFLALRLEVDLQRRLDEREVDVAWPDLMRDLGQVHAVEVLLDGQGYLLRTDLKGSAWQAFAAAGVRPPPPVTPRNDGSPEDS